jgi:hypothetical protein
MRSPGALVARRSSSALRLLASRPTRPAESLASRFGECLLSRLGRRGGVRAPRLEPGDARALALVGDGIRQLERYAPLALSGFAIHIHEGEDPIRVDMMVAPAGLPASVEYGVTLVVRNMGVETEHRVSFEWASFTHEPDDVCEIEHVLGCGVRTRASWAGIAVSRSA